MTVSIVIWHWAAFMLFYGRGGFLPPARYLVSFSIKSRIAMTRLTIAVIRLIVLACWSFLLPLFLCGFLLNVFIPPFWFLLYYTRTCMSIAFWKNVKKFTPTGKNPPWLLNAQKPQNRHAEDFCEYLYFIVRNKPRSDLNAADRIALHNYALDLNARREVWLW